MKTFEFANAHGRLGMLIAGPEKPPTWYWSGRGDVPEQVRKALTEGIRDPETVAAKVRAGASFIVMGNHLEATGDYGRLELFVRAAHGE